MIKIYYYADITANTIKFPPLADGDSDEFNSSNEDDDDENGNGDYHYVVPPQELHQEQKNRKRKPGFFSIVFSSSKLNLIQDKPPFDVGKSFLFYSFHYSLLVIGHLFFFRQRLVFFLWFEEPARTSLFRPLGNLAVVCFCMSSRFASWVIQLVIDQKLTMWLLVPCSLFQTVDREH